MAEQEREQVKALLTQEAAEGVTKDDLQDLVIEFERALNMAHVKLLEKFALTTVARAADVQRQADIDKLALESERNGLSARVRDLEQDQVRAAQKPEPMALIVGGGAPPIEELRCELEVCEKVAPELLKESFKTNSPETKRAYSEVIRRIQELRQLTDKKPSPAPNEVTATSFAINYPASSSVETSQLNEAMKLQQQAKTGDIDTAMVTAAKPFIDAVIRQISANDSSSVASHITQSAEALVIACSQDMAENKRILVDNLTNLSSNRDIMLSSANTGQGPASSDAMLNSGDTSLRVFAEIFRFPVRQPSELRELHKTEMRSVLANGVAGALSKVEENGTRGFNCSVEGRIRLVRRCTVQIRIAKALLEAIEQIITGFGRSKVPLIVEKLQQLLATLERMLTSPTDIDRIAVINRERSPGDIVFEMCVSNVNIGTNALQLVRAAFNDGSEVNAIFHFMDEYRLCITIQDDESIGQYVSRATAAIEVLKNSYVFSARILANLRRHFKFSKHDSETPTCLEAEHVLYSIVEQISVRGIMVSAVGEVFKPDVIESFSPEKGNTPEALAALVATVMSKGVSTTFPRSKFAAPREQRGGAAKGGDIVETGNAFLGHTKEADKPVKSAGLGKHEVEKIVKGEIYLNYKELATGDQSKSDIALSFQKECEEEFGFKMFLEDDKGKVAYPLRFLNEMNKIPPKDWPSLKKAGKKLSNRQFATYIFLKDTNPGNPNTTNYGKAYRQSENHEWCMKMSSKRVSRWGNDDMTTRDEGNKGKGKGKGKGNRRSKSLSSMRQEE
jgi:hypothetical protein